MRIVQVVSLLGGIFLACQPSPDRRSVAPDPWDRADSIVAAIKPPHIPERVFDLRDYGARGDGHADDRPALQAALAAAAAAGGGQVRLGPGIYRCDGPLALSSHVELHLTAEATLRFSPEPAHYLPAVFTRWEGVELFNYSPFIYTTDATDVAITGAGTIDGQAGQGWAAWKDLQGPARDRLRDMGAEQVPLAERVFGEGYFLRPALIQFVRCARIRIEGIRIVAAPFWIIHPIYSRDIVVRGVDFHSLIINNDGIDLDSSTDVLIEECTFRTGDDAVAIKSGRDQDGWRVGQPSARIVIRRCQAPEVLHGFACGSEMSGGVEDVFIEDCHLGRVHLEAIQFKANRDRGGYIRNVYVRNVSVDSAGGHLIFFTNDYHGYRGGNAPAQFTGFHLAHLRCGYAREAIQLQGLPDQPLREVVLHDIQVQRAEKALTQAFVENLRMDSVYVNGEPLQGRALSSP